MAKWAGKIGFYEESETSPGIWEEHLVERKYYGDVISNTRNLDNGAQINDGITVSNRISFVSDPYARRNFFNIRYITFMGSKWKVDSIDVEYPRLIARLGGLYNVEEQTQSAS